jgi:LemA protein
MLWILLAVVLAVLIALVALYNSLVRNRQLVREGWSGISVQLKRRADLIPNLLATVQGYMTHERELLNEVTALRARAQALGDTHPAERAAAEGLLGAALGRLIAVAENYPDLKASANFLEFQESLETIENELQFARRYYNGAARQYNTAVEQFPSNLVAGSFGFEPAEFFTLDDPADAAVPKVSFAPGAPQ